MKSTASFGIPAPYLGADLTDRYAATVRPIDVCGLWPTHDGTFEAHIWTWEWQAREDPVDGGPIAAEIRAARAAMLDGPQALATTGCQERICERECGAPGKTPDHLRETGRPFDGYVRSSVELFAALHRHGLTVSPPGFVGGVSEYYPGDAWRRLVAAELRKKDTSEGRRRRRTALETVGVTGLPDLPSHDQNDACLGALLAAAADGRVPGLDIEAVGQALGVDPDGTLREGPMAVPQPDHFLAHRMADAIDAAGVPTISQPKRGSRNPNLDTAQPAGLDGAEALFRELVQLASEGNPTVCTYIHAYARVFNVPTPKWSQAYTHKLLEAAKCTTPMHLPGLGMVQLDTFIVSASGRRPADGHWLRVPYGPSDWMKVLGNARVLHRNH